MESQQQHRPIWEIASEPELIAWVRSPSGAYAKPYWNAMTCLTSLSQRYGEDSADSIVRYFLSNARTWRGATARRVKAELNAMLKAGAR